jgi:hypothetical protein
MTEFAIKKANSLNVAKLFLKSELKVEHMFLQPKHEEQVTNIENSLPFSRLIIRTHQDRTKQEITSE